MLIVAAEAVVEEGAIDGVRDALLAMEEATRKEAGCITYAFSVDLSAPTVLRIFERWESMDALSAHFKTSHGDLRAGDRQDPAKVDGSEAVRGGRGASTSEVRTL